MFSSYSKWALVDYCLHVLPYQIRAHESRPTAKDTEIARFIIEEIMLKHGAPKKMISVRGDVPSLHDDPTIDHPDFLKYTIK